MKTIAVFVVMLILALSCTSSGKKEKLSGATLYRKHCVTCHGANGKLQLNGAKDITLSEMSVGERVKHVRDGKGLMTPFKDVLSPAEINAVVDYSMTLKVEE